MDLNLQLPQSVVFGRGKFKELIKYIQPYGKRVILVTGKSSFLNSSHWNSLEIQLKANQIDCILISIQGEPTPEMIDDAVVQSADFNPNLVVGVGGGSVLDAGKAISAMIPLAQPVEAYLEGVPGRRTHPGNKVPFIAVPTTSGTGSEATKNAVICRVGAKGYKKSLRHDHFVPDIAFIDPELTLSCRENTTAWSGMDAFTQLLESYLSTKANDFTDAIALSGLKAINKGLERVVIAGDDYDARESMAYAALCSGIALANAGLGTIHGFASSIGAKYPIPHGLICGSLMGVVNEFTLNSLLKHDAQNIAISKYAEVGKIFHGSTDKDKVFYAEFLINKIHDLSQKLNLPKLSVYGFDHLEINAIASDTSNKNNPIALGQDQLSEILSEVV